MNSIFHLAQMPPSGNTKVKIKYVNGKLVVEIIADPNKPKECDAARALVEQRMGLSGKAESTVKRSPVENKMLQAPMPEIETAPAEQERQKF